MIARFHAALKPLIPKLPHGAVAGVQSVLGIARNKPGHPMGAAPKREQVYVFLKLSLRAAAHAPGRGARLSRLMPAGIERQPEGLREFGARGADFLTRGELARGAPIFLKRAVTREARTNLALQRKRSGALEIAGLPRDELLALAIGDGAPAAERETRSRPVRAPGRAFTVMHSWR